MHDVKCNDQSTFCWHFGNCSKVFQHSNGSINFSCNRHILRTFKLWKVILSSEFQLLNENEVNICCAIQCDINGNIRCNFASSVEKIRTGRSSVIKRESQNFIEQYFCNNIIL